jgi:hypothetical protein
VLFYRKSQNVNEDEEERRAQLLKSALTFSNEASEKACGSKEMLECTSKHIDFFKKQYAKIITECIPDT